MVLFLYEIQNDEHVSFQIFLNDDSIKKGPKAGCRHQRCSCRFGVRPDPAGGLQGQGPLRVSGRWCLARHAEAQSHPDEDGIGCSWLDPAPVFVPSAVQGLARTP